MMLQSFKSIRIIFTKRTRIIVISDRDLYMDIGFLETSVKTASKEIG